MAHLPVSAGPRTSYYVVRLVGAAALIVVSLAFALNAMNTPTIGGFSPAAPVPRIASRMPDFTLPTTTGQVFSTSRLNGNVVIINFWATWCVPCREEMPALQQVYGAYRARGLVLIGVNYGEEADEVVRYAREIGISFPLALDRDTAVAQRYQVQGLPTTVFVDRRGIIRDMAMGGPMSAVYIRDKVVPLLDEP